MFWVLNNRSKVVVYILEPLQEEAQGLIWEFPKIGDPNLGP